MTHAIKGLKFLVLSLGSVTAILGTGFASVSQAQMPGVVTTETIEQVSQGVPSIVDIVATSGSFDTLVAALKAADLVDTLSGDGPFTVFAPTDAAFSALPDGVLASLLKPENKDLLTQVLTYHVVEGSVMSSALTSGDLATLGGDMMVDVSASSIKVNDAQVLGADIQGSNGIIHAIDQVMVPESVAKELSIRIAAEKEANMTAGEMPATDVAADNMEAASTTEVPMAEAPMAQPEAILDSTPMKEPESTAPAEAQPVRGLW
jgi:uncharacterized surface protein with fasciclin (FAS1) repeats